MSGGEWLVLGCIVLAWWLMRATSRTTSTVTAARGHSHGGPPAVIRRHEGAHVVAARAVGGTVTSVHVTRHGGEVDWHMPSRTPTEQRVRANIAFLRAGEYATGTSRGCADDRGEVERQLRYLPRDRRKTVRAAGEQDARRIVRQRRAEITAVAKNL